MNGTDPPPSGHAPHLADVWGNDMPWLGRRLKLVSADNLDASPTSTHYSSCGERLGRYDDSDLDKATGYASANSLGTPTLCSSFGSCTGFLDSDMGSVRSMSFHEDQNLEPLEQGYDTEGSSQVRSFTRFNRKPNKRNFHGKRGSVLDIRPKPAATENDVGIGCLSKDGDVLFVERNKAPALCVESENLLISRETLELKDLNNGTQQSAENEISNNAGGGILLDRPHRALYLHNPVGHEIIQEKSDSSEIRAIECFSKIEYGQSDSLGCQTKQNLEGACKTTGRTDLDQIKSPSMAGYQETNSAHFISGTSSSKNLREFSSGHGQEVSGSASEKELSVAVAHDLQMLSLSDKLSEYDSQSEFDSILGQVTDEEDACYLSEKNRLSRMTTNQKEVDTGNSLLLNPEVVFGAGDWDEFVQEVGENDLQVADLMEEAHNFHISHAESGIVFSETADTPEDTGVTSKLNIEDASSSLTGDAAMLASKNVLRTQFDRVSLCSSNRCGRPYLEEDDRREFLRAMDYVQPADEFHSNVKDVYAGTEIFTRGDVQIPSQSMNCLMGFHLAEEEEEERNLRLQKPHIEAFYPESQNANKDVLLLQASHMKVQDHVYEKEVECLSDKDDTKDEAKSHLKYDEHLVRQVSNVTGLSSGSVPDIDALYFPTMAAEKFIDKTPIVEINSEGVLLGSSRLRNNFSCDTCPNGGAKDARDWEKDDLGPDELSRYVEALDVNESYVDTVHDMEDVLLDSGESAGARFAHASRGFTSQSSGDYRDEVSSASIADADNAHPHMQYFQKLDWVEVVGAKQKKGNVSFGERLIGVKEYTVYQIKVRSGTDQWEIERRYRDFLGLYRQLKRLFAVHSGASLPSPWEHVERESRKVFGTASPDVVTERSALVQECLQSLVLAGSPFDSTPPLFWFLLPHTSFSDTPATLERHSPEIQTVSKEKGSGSQFKESFPLRFPTGPILNEYRQGDGETFSAFGKTIRLIVQTHPHKSMKQLLEAQHYSCAGCYKHLDMAKGLMQGFAQTFGWGKPRLCEYMGQLFCTSCHSNETAILPARVLQLWDFTPCPVSQLAKAYLDSIYDRPMLCVSAVNPFTFSKVPVLVYVMDMRKKLSKMIACIRCPFRTWIQQSLVSRRYLLESSDFFALRDLVDLSKGAFAALPSLMDCVSKKIYMHITQQCSICCEVGESCSAHLKCEKPSSLIFPFQEGGVMRCESCQMVFHQSCFLKLSHCPCSGTNCSDDLCGKLASCDESDVKSYVQIHSSVKSDNSLDPCLSKQGSTSGKGFFTDLFQKASLDNIWKPRKNSRVLNMASLSSSPGL